AVVGRFRERLQTATLADLPGLLANPRPDGILGGITEDINHSLSRARLSVEQQRMFVADAAHELRSPIASLVTTLEVAERHPELVDQSQVRATSLAQARRLQRLTQDLLVLASLDARRPLRQEPVDLATVVADVAVRSWTTSSKLTVAPMEPLPVIGDAATFDQILTNLVENGVRHADEHVALTASQRDGWIEIRVANDGDALPDADLERIFERFVR